jgi:hypothetical protein
LNYGINKQNFSYSAGANVLFAKVVNNFSYFY